MFAEKITFLSETKAVFQWNGSEVAMQKIITTLCGCLRFEQLIGKESAAENAYQLRLFMGLIASLAVDRAAGAGKRVLASLAAHALWGWKRLGAMKLNSHS